MFAFASSESLEKKLLKKPSVSLQCGTQTPISMLSQPSLLSLKK